MHWKTLVISNDILWRKKKQVVWTHKHVSTEMNLVPTGLPYIPTFTERINTSTGKEACDVPNEVLSVQIAKARVMWP